ncbi:MAG: carbamoyl phosphate synthase large subunit [Proteobacteria bacterium SG_bin7]|nr:MAG: carbamoyl phosphate synthase large subunit [Proteobacteria bacterium SG_bin7]
MGPYNIKKVLIIGSGPIVIGQACEFDYSGTQACKALMARGFEVILVNSNPATIMTDPDIATRVYIEPLRPDYIEKIVEAEKPDAVIPTLGGQTALNLALQMEELGIWKKHNVRMLGANPTVIRAAEDRLRFQKICDSVGAKYARSAFVKDFNKGLEVAKELSFPLILRPNYTLGGTGGGIAYTLEEYERLLSTALRESPTSEVLVEQSLLGWKEFELEIMRDRTGTFVVICSIENFDPCGVHTGDSITVAPQQTLSDQAYQSMRNEAKKVIEAVGVETGGANIQFAVDPVSGERMVIEVNPRVSRSSALASKATGFPIAKIAALLAVGYTLEEIKNDITKTTPCCYEPALDYVVTKIPRFAFEKFPGTPDVLTTQMKSVGEVMGIGRTFKESFQKALASMERKEIGLGSMSFSEPMLAFPNSKRVYAIAGALRAGKTIQELYELTHITPWFLEQIKEIVDFEKDLSSEKSLNADTLLRAKRLGFTDKSIAHLSGKKEIDIYRLREQFGLRPGYLKVDTCAGEFASDTPYYYSTYWSSPVERRKQDSLVVILGSGPNRIGQGIEFDYGCVRAVKQFRNQKMKVIMVNSNPETVSTDYDTSDELYFEPLTGEHVLEVFKFTGPIGFMAQLGGQTPINIARHLVDGGYPVLGSSLESIDLAEDRGRFAKICNELKFKIPASGMAGDFGSATKIAESIGFPIICRPSYVLGGRRMEIVENFEELKDYFERNGDVIGLESPCLIDEFIEGALEVDVDLVRGQDWSLIGGIVEHIEAAGVHSGDSMGVIPPQRLKDETCGRIEKMALALADRMNVIGILNLQLAIKNDQVILIEANPRASRTIPFVSKATGIPLIDLGVLAVLGRTSKELSLSKYRWQNVNRVSVKGVVFPFKKFPNADSILGPEMKSTGESMGVGTDYSEALLKACIASHIIPPKDGEVFLSLREKDKGEILPVARELVSMGFTLSATSGTAKFLVENGLPCISVRKVLEGRPHCVDRIKSGIIKLVINTTRGRKSIEASFSIRRSCIERSIPCLTESDAALAFLHALRHYRQGKTQVGALNPLISI